MKGLLFKKRLILTLTTTLALLLSTATANQAVVLKANVVENTPIVEAASAEVLSAATSSITPSRPRTINVEQYVRSYFTKTPILAEVARCESQFRQFGKNGKVLRGMLVSEDVGVMQINEYFHKDTSIKLGMDLHTIDGNLSYAKYLYDREGTQPWSASEACWNK